MSAKNIVAKTWTITPSFTWPDATLRRCFNYPAGNKPIGYQSNPTLLMTDINSGSLTGFENNKGCIMSLYGLNIGKPQDLGLITQPRVYMRDPVGDNTWHEVDNYRAIRPSFVFPRMPVMEIIVQVGALGGSQVNGRVLDIKITVNGTDTNVLNAAFMIQPGGRCFYVDNVSGDDATGVPDDPTHPYRYLQKYSGTTPSGIWAIIRPGDTIIPRDTGTPWSDQTGFEGKMLRFFSDSGIAARGTVGTVHTAVLGVANNGSGAVRVQIGSTAGLSTGDVVDIFGVRPVSTDTGANGHWTITVIDGSHIDLQGSTYGGAWQSRGTVTNYSGYIHITSYPGPVNGNAPEMPRLVPAADQPGIIHGCGSLQSFLHCGRYWSVSRLHLENSAATTSAPSDSGLINLQDGADGVRIIGNDLGPYLVGPSVTNVKNGGVSGVGVGVTVWLNHIHDIHGSSALENHAIYAGGDDNNGYQQCAQNWDVGWNWAHDISGGSCFQTNWANSTVPAGKRFQNIVVHHNYFDTCAKYGINWGPSTTSGRSYNNIVANSGWAAFRIQPSTTTETTSIDIRHAHDTVYNPNTAQKDTMGAVELECNLTAGTVKYQHCIFYVKAGAKAYFTSYNGPTADSGVITFDRNLYYDESGTLTTSAAPSTAVHTDANKIYGDPLFTDAANGNFTLRSGSPAIDTALSTPIITLTDDFYGVHRPQGSYQDIGACEGVGT